jgi:hypothetical protein
MLKFKFAIDKIENPKTKQQVKGLICVLYDKDKAQCHSAFDFKKASKKDAVKLLEAICNQLLQHYQENKLELYG